MSTSRVTDLTVDQLRALIREEMRDLVREAVREVLNELTEGDDDDPDAGLSLKPEIAERLDSYLKERPQGRSLNDVMGT